VNAPQDAFKFIDPVGISRHILKTVNSRDEAIDRIDRLALVQSILPEIREMSSSDDTFPPSTAAYSPEHVEQIRTEAETITNFHPVRVNAWRKAADELYTPINTEAEELLNVALSIERALRERISKSVSETELIRRATRTIMETHGAAWTEAFPDIDRLTLLGLSSISAPHIDLVHALLDTTSVEIQFHLRHGTGPYLKDRVRSLLDVTAPGREVPR
jgi:ATP-dependent helicase/nuclease subunit B